MGITSPLFPAENAPNGDLGKLARCDKVADPEDTENDVAVCHHAGFTASSSIAAIDGETVDAYSDFLLHDVGTGDGIVQGGAEANELRTPPLWGALESAPYLHDGSAATIKEAIRRHANQAAAAQQAFRALSDADQQALVAFLNSL